MTLILDTYYGVDSNALYSAASKKGIPVQRVNFTDSVSGTQNPIIYLDTNMADYFLTQLNIELLSPPLNWLTTLPYRYTHRLTKELTWKESKTHPEKGFYKPADWKWFKAGVFEKGSDIGFTWGICNEPEDKEMVIFSEIVDFEVEYRFFVSKRVPQTGSLYAIDGQSARTDKGWPIRNEELLEATAFISELCSDPEVSMVDALVIDVGRFRDTNTWAVVEANPAWASGLYGCDADKVLQVLRVCSKMKKK